MKNKAAVKPSPKIFSTWVEQRDLIKISSSLSTEAVAQELLSSLTAGKKQILWDLLCATLFSLSPAHAHVVIAEQSTAVPAPKVNGQIKDIQDIHPEEPARRYGKRLKITVSSDESKENLLPENPNEKAQIVLACTKQFLVHLKDKEPANLRTVIDVLNYILTANLCGEKAIQICEIIWRKKWTGYKHLGAQCFQYMLAEVVNNSSCTKTDVKRLVLYKEIVDSTASWITQALPNMASCLINKTVLSDGSSPGLLSKFFMLNVKCIEVFHNEIKKALINQTTAEAKVYGLIYGIALSKASPDIQEVIKTKCLQDFIHKFINVQWDLKAQKMKPHGFLLEALLEELYYSTVGNAVGFKLLLEAYEPLLWRNLSSANPLQRANSTKLLFLMYPIEPPNTTRVDQEILTNKQNEFILMSLEDPNHVVRLIAVKKIKTIIFETWKVMPRTIRVAVCNALFNKLAFDKASAEIRRTTLLTILSLIDNDNYQMCLFLSKFFKFLKLSIYDECKQVRKAMLQVLLALQNFSHPKAFAHQDDVDGLRVACCWDVVALHELVEVMAMEEANSSTLKMCVELAFKSIHPTEPVKEKTQLSRVIWLIKQGQQVARNFYENSGQVLPPKEALEFLTKVVGRLGAFYKVYDKNGKLLKKEPQPKGRKRKAAEMESTLDEEKFAESGEVGIEQSHERMLEPVATSLKESKIVAGLLDIVMVIWVKHAKAFNDQSHSEALSIFETTVQQALGFVFREWKDNIEVLGPVLYMGSMLPSKGMKRLLTFCINRLKTLITSNGGVPDQEMKLLATGVCNWDSPDILLDMNAEWLTECLKGAVTKVKPKGKNGKVSVDLELENKAAAGLLILEKVLVHPVAHAVIIKKSQKSMVSLLKVTGGVKKVISHRLTTGAALASMSDDLIWSCFKRYVALINLIPSNKDTDFDANNEYVLLLTWAEKTILPHTQTDKQLQPRSSKPALVVKLLSVLLRNLAIAAHKNLVSNKLMVKMVAFCHKVLATAASAHLMFSLLCVGAALFVNSVLVKQGKRDGTASKDLLDTTLPKLLCAILDTSALSPQLELLIERDVVAKNELKSNVEELYAAFYAYFPKNSVQIYSLDKAFVKAVFKPLLSTASSSEQGLPYMSEFLFNEFQHSSQISPDKFWQLLRCLVEEGLGLTPQGRSAVEVFLVVVGTKWPGMLPRRYVDECQKLLARMFADEAEAPEEMIDLNQSFVISQQL